MSKSLWKNLFFWVSLCNYLLPIFSIILMMQTEPEKAEAIAGGVAIGILLMMFVGGINLLCMLIRKDKQVLPVVFSAIPLIGGGALLLIMLVMLVPYLMYSV